MPIMMAQKPAVLMLKDFLELDLDSTSPHTFLCAPRRLPSSPSTIRCLLDADLSNSRKLIRSRSKNAISAVASLSKLLLRRSFWRSRRADSTASKQPSIRVRDIVSLQSFNDVIDVDCRSLYLPSPVVSNCSSASSSDDGADSSDFMISSCGSSEFSGEAGGAAAAAGGETAVGNWQSEEEVKNEVIMECEDCDSEEEKEQLSPVSVMDFPSEEEDGEDGDGDDDDTTASPQFRRVLDTIERTRQELLQKIRRFESLAELDLKPIDLESRFESVTSDEEEEDRDAAWELLCQLKGRMEPEDWLRSNEKLLLEFFDEGLCSSQNRDVEWRKRGRTDGCMEEDLMASASEWIGGNGCVSREEMGGVEQLKEMGRGGGGWMCLEEGEEEVAEEVEAGVLGWLVGELVLDLVS